MTTYFVTGTDTDVGKTVACASLASYFLKQNKKVCVYKPIQCGDLLVGDIKSSDLAFINSASGADVYNTYAFDMPASPHLAAEQESIEIDKQKILDELKELQQKYEIVIVEGAGGLLVPLSRTYTMCDLIEDIGAPVIVVARAGLGTINHTSLTLSELQGNEIHIAGVIFNFYRGGTLEDDNRQYLTDQFSVKILGSLPYAEDIKTACKDFELHNI